MSGSDQQKTLGFGVKIATPVIREIHAQVTCNQCDFMETARPSVHDMDSDLLVRLSMMAIAANHSEQTGHQTSCRFSSVDMVNLKPRTAGDRSWPVPFTGQSKKPLAKGGEA